MRDRYRMYRRGNVFYAKDRTTGQAVTLATSNQEKAKKLLQAKNQAVEQSQLNMAMARVYLSCKTPEMLERTWNDVMLDMEQAYHGPTLTRWRKQMRSAPFQSLLKLKLLETESSHFLAVLRQRLMRILEQLPKEGFLFPKLAQQNDAVRASRFLKRRKQLGLSGISLHSYRYAWAQRAKASGNSAST